MPRLAKIISVDMHAKLSIEDQQWYEPYYQSYKERRYREYEECNLGHKHYLGWATKYLPVGEMKYKKLTPSQYHSTSRSLVRLYTADMMEGPTFSTDASKSRSITFTRYAPLK